MKKETQTYKRSKIVFLFKRILLLLKVVLPPTWYDGFYKVNFRAYKSLIRFFYLRYYFYYYFKGDKENLKKTKIIYGVMPYSLVGAGGLAQTYDLAKEVVNKNIEGSLVECGVAGGGCAALMALVANDNNVRSRELWLFDSFEGLPNPTNKDFLNECSKIAGEFIRPLEKGSCLGTYEEVQKLLFSKFRIDPKNVVMVRGWFQDTLPQYKGKINKISLLRIDADWYESTKCCLDNFYDNVVGGGFVVIDDYETCFGAKRALNEFLQERKLAVTLSPDGRGGCYFIKPLKKYD